MRLLIVALLCLAASVPARADNTEARQHFDKANAAYALGDYAVAAQEYEKAFALKPDPALLYNAAQAHRVAGNKQRALLLYQNYLRVFGAVVSNRDEVLRHIEALKQAIETDKSAETNPPTSPAPIGGAQAPATPPPTTTAPVTTPPTTATTTNADLTRPAPEKPLTKKPWFWAVVGGAAVVVVAGVAIGLGVGLSGDKNPSPSLGAVAGN